MVGGSIELLRRKCRCTICSSTKEKDRRELQGDCLVEKKNYAGSKTVCTCTVSAKNGTRLWKVVFTSFFVPTIIINYQLAEYAGQATCILCLEQFCQNIISEGVVSGSTRNQGFT
jgi:hypothetical protein